MDLSTLDPTKPDNSELARLGAGRIRDVSGSVITSFEVEHSLAGPHAFLMGSTAMRPAPGNKGRLYFNTDRSLLETDNTAEWVVAHTIARYSTSLISAVALTHSYQDVASLSADCTQETNLIAWGSILVGVPGPASVLDFRITLDGTPLAEQALPFQPTFSNLPTGSNFPAQFTLPAAQSHLTEGTRVIALQARQTLGLAATVTNRSLHVTLM